MKKKANNKASAFVTIFLILALAVTAFIYYMYSPDYVSILPKTQIIDIPIITTRVISENGEAHAVDAQISIEFSEYNPETIDIGTLQRLVLDAVSDLEYEKLRQPGNIAYIQDEVISKITEYLPREEIVGAYISELQCGDIRIASPPPASTTPGERGNTAQRLFGGLR